MVLRTLLVRALRLLFPPTCAIRSKPSPPAAPLLLITRRVLNSSSGHRGNSATKKGSRLAAPCSLASLLISAAACCCPGWLAFLCRAGLHAWHASVPVSAADPE